MKKPVTVAEWDAMSPEEQDALIASGWHPGPGAYSDRALQVRYARRDRAYWKDRARSLEEQLRAACRERDEERRFADKFQDELRESQEQLEAATSEDFSLVPKDEYARLKGIEEQVEAARIRGNALCNAVEIIQQERDGLRQLTKALSEQLEAADETLRLIARTCGAECTEPDEWRTLVQPTPAEYALDEVRRLQEQLDATQSALGEIVAGAKEARDHVDDLEDTGAHVGYTRYESARTDGKGWAAFIAQRALDGSPAAAFISDPAETPETSIPATSSEGSEALAVRGSQADLGNDPSDSSPASEPEASDVS